MSFSRGKKGGGRDEDKKRKKDKDNSGAGSSKRAKDAPRRVRNTHGDFGFQLEDTEGEGTAESPLANPLDYPPPPADAYMRDAYIQVVRDAANLTGLGVWYIRSLIHNQTTFGGETENDDSHFTVFADRQTGARAEDRFDFHGHLYTVPAENGNYPLRLLHEQEFEIRGPAEDGHIYPIMLHDPVTLAPLALHPDDNYYDYYDGAGQSFEDGDVYEEEEAGEFEGAYDEGVQQVGEGTEQGVATGKARKKRKRKSRGKGKGKDKSTHDKRSGSGAGGAVAAFQESVARLLAICDSGKRHCWQ